MVARLLDEDGAGGASVGEVARWVFQVVMMDCMVEVEVVWVTVVMVGLLTVVAGRVFGGGGTPTTAAAC